MNFIHTSKVVAGDEIHIAQRCLAIHFIGGIACIVISFDHPFQTVENEGNVP